MSVYRGTNINRKNCSKRNTFLQNYYSDKHGKQKMCILTITFKKKLNNYGNASAVKLN
jgi:hypothetical protein